MVAEVESTPKLEDVKTPEIAIITKQLFSILRRITISGNEAALRANMEDFRSKVGYTNELHHFHWGFGGGHMWIKQRGNDKRLIFVKLLNAHI